MDTAIADRVGRIVLLAALLLLIVLGTGIASAFHWEIETVDSAGSVGEESSLAIDSMGNPHISYYDSTNRDLKHAWHDSSGWHTETVDSSGNVGEFSSIALDGTGAPRISYLDRLNDYLKYAWYDSSGWHTETVDASGEIWGWTSLALDSAGAPRISYVDGLDPDLKYAWRDGSAWRNETVDSAGQVGYSSDLALDDAGNPQISYSDVANLDMKYAWHDASGWHNETVDTVGNVGFYTSIALDHAGNPHISYFDTTNFDPKYAWRDDAGWQFEIVDPVGLVGEWTSLALDGGGSPRISYYANHDGNQYVKDLKYAWRDGSGWRTETVDAAGDVGMWTSLVLDGNGVPRISYYDNSNGDLKYARALAPPAVSFSAAPTAGTAPLVVNFTDASTGDGITAWSWDFGDGATSTEPNPVHAYAIPGIYSVNLTVTNEAGAAWLSKTDYIIVLTPTPPGGGRGYFLVSTEPSGAEIYLEDLSGQRTLQGNTSAGPLNVSICLSCAPVTKLIATLPGYREAVYAIVQNPAEGASVPVNLVLERAGTPGPFPSPHIPWVLIQAEDFDAGGEGVAYHDVEPANLGGVYRNEGVDIETEDGVTDVGWIRDGEFLRYSVDTTIAGNFYLTLRAANPDTITKAVTVYLDGTPVGEVMVGPTGAWTSYAEFSMPTPMVMTTGRHVIALVFEGTSRINLDWLRVAAGTVPVVTTTPTPAPSGATFAAVPLTAQYGSAVKFTLTPAAGKTVKAVWWSFDAPAHLQTWNSREINPTFFYPRAGTFSPLVRITYTDNTVEEVQRVNSIQAT